MDQVAMTDYLTIRHKWSNLPSHQIGFTLYRYPTSILWGDDHADGFRMIWAESPEKALVERRCQAAGTQIQHLQHLTPEDGWRFVASEADRAAMRRTREQ